MGHLCCQTEPLLHPQIQKYIQYHCLDLMSWLCFTFFLAPGRTSETVKAAFVFFRRAKTDHLGIWSHPFLSLRILGCDRWSKGTAGEEESALGIWMKKIKLNVETLRKWNQVKFKKLLKNIWFYNKEAGAFFPLSTEFALPCHRSSSLN